MNNNLKGEILLMETLGIKPNYAALAKQYGMDWRTVKKYHEGYTGKPKTRHKTSRLDRYQTEIRDKLKIRRITVKGVYEFMVDRYGIDELGTYSNFITYVKKHQLIQKKSHKAHPRYETMAGQQGQVDWKEDIPLVSKSGEKHVLNVCHMVLGFSKYSHLEISIQRRTDDVYRCLINCFEALGGVPEELLFDNMSTVASVNGRKKSVTKGMSGFAKDFGFKVRLCGTRKPETKGTVEARNKVIDWIRAYHGEFGTLEDLAEIIKEINTKMNIMINQETGMSPAALFYKEKEYLQPLPRASIMDTYLTPNKYKVSDEALIRYGNSRYSVSPGLIGEEVTVDVLSNKLYIYYNGKLVTNHALNDNPINYHENHYTEIMKGKVRETDMASVVSQNLKLMDRLLESRKVEVSNMEAGKSMEALMAYLNDSPYGNWIIGRFAHLSKENRSTFVKGMNRVLPYVANKEMFMSRLKFSVKSNGCRTLDYDCWMNDFMAAYKAEVILTDEGYEIIRSRYEKEITDFIEEQTALHGENENDE